MRARVASISALGIVAGASFWSGAARAQSQIDTNPPQPNVLILLDNSGSMERMIDGTLPENSTANACNCTDNGSGTLTCTYPDSAHPSANSPVPNRWNTVQQSLTGYLSAQTGARSGFNCVAMPRGPNSTFTNEYQIAGTNPYDTNYYLPFHRMVAEDTSAGVGSAVPCVVAPGNLAGATGTTGAGIAPEDYQGGNATDYDPTATTYRKYGTYTVPGTCNFTQLSNGPIPTSGTGGMSAFMRFGLMTFDSDPDPGTGVTTSNQVSTTPFTGMWSYFPGWLSGSTCNFAPTYTAATNCMGEPANCTTLQSMAVGARNGGAPPWEGRMVPLPTPSGLTQQQSNAEVAQVILASRPYGATPLAGMMTGAQYYFQGDPTGPQSDPLVQTSGGACRKEFVVLITDGVPNLDLQPGCGPSTGADGGTTSGTCPFNQPWQIAQSLYNNGIASSAQQFVTTYVIGFATSSFSNDGGSLVHCSDLITQGTLGTTCPITGAAPSDPNYTACCQLQQIAYYGGSGQAYFADTALALQDALGAVLSSIGSSATTRTVPTFSPVLSAGNAAVYNAFLYPNVGGPWSGDIKRTTYSCPSGGSASATLNTTNVNNGDDFAVNLNTKTTPSSRTFVVVEPTLTSTPTTHDGSASVRPFAPTTTSTTDGLLFETSTQYSGSATTLTTDIATSALNITTGTNSYAYTPITTTGAGAQEYLSDTQTRSMILSYIFGQANPGLPSDFGWVSRCTSCADGNTGVPSNGAFGDIYHATPIVVGPPSSLLDDVSYSGFRTYITASSGGGDGGTTASTREPMVYAPTNDGLLHGFYADKTTEVANEAWAMLLPSAMPQILSSYPSTDKMLADGSPVTKDVVWDRTGISATACASGSTTCPWHTSLVAGYGASQQGYYSVDVTSTTSPTFRWQLTKMGLTSGYEIFGKEAATPAIATVLVNDSMGVPHETGVAILPGGIDSGPTSTTKSCERIHHHTPSGGDGTDSQPATSYQERTNVRCWGSTATYTDRVNGRSLSIVRLDTGEILRVFARAADFGSSDAVATSPHNIVTDTQLDSPMTGMPIVYPSDVGAITTRIFAGDADGTVWRFDVSNPDPTKWFGDAFIDLYNQTVDTSSTAWQDGQAFDVPMVASLDSAGSLVLNIASGSTQTFDTNGTYFLYSVSEKVGGSPTKLRAQVNWYWGSSASPATTTPSGLRIGERVSGPMTVFNGTLFFSTYYAGNSTTTCNPGQAKLWGFNFNTANGGVVSAGGTRFAPLTCSSTQDWTDPGETCGTRQPGVVPGVAIIATPACTTQGTASFGSGGSHHSITAEKAGAYSLVANIGASAGSPATQATIGLSTPLSPTLIDSWASVVE
jgi:type IV pilus assembly protein PilY1